MSDSSVLAAGPRAKTASKEAGDKFASECGETPAAPECEGTTLFGGCARNCHGRGIG